MQKRLKSNANTFVSQTSEKDGAQRRRAQGNWGNTVIQSQYICQIHFFLFRSLPQKSNEVLGWTCSCSCSCSCIDVLVRVCVAQHWFWIDLSVYFYVRVMNWFSNTFSVSINFHRNFIGISSFLCVEFVLAWALYARFIPFSFQVFSSGIIDHTRNRSSF